MKVSAVASQPPSLRPSPKQPPKAPDQVELGGVERLPDYRFAYQTSRQDLLKEEEVASDFLERYLEHEAKFFHLARDPQSGLTFDGVNLDPRTGQPVSIRGFSAASKECLDLGLLVKGLYGDPLISKVLSYEDPAKAPEMAAEILAKKMASYEQFQQEYPGFAGYFTWFESGDQARPLGEWADQFPTLDLGEMLWSLLLVEKALRDTGRPELAARYKAYNDGMKEKAVESMYNPELRRVRGRVHIEDPSSPDTRYFGNNAMTGEHGVHEGQMIVLYMTLFCDLPEGVADEIWDDITMKRVEHEHGSTWEGFWASPHEEWAHLFLPYRDHDGFRDLFRIREKIRTHNAVERGYPGLSASAHNPAKEGGYMSAAGVEEISSQPILHNDTYTVYGAFPLLLQFAGELTGNVGLAWLHNMLLGTKMQGPIGAGESGSNDGTGSAPVKTIDASFTNLLAMAGGLERETADLLQEMGQYDQFLARMGAEYEETFGEAPLREPSGFALPGPPAPAGLIPDYEQGLGPTVLPKLLPGAPTPES